MVGLGRVELPTNGLGNLAALSGVLKTVDYIRSVKRLPKLRLTGSVSQNAILSTEL
jgi:hypothetical protein